MFREPENVYGKHFLMPAQLIVTANPTVVTTILGSCVAVCMYDVHKKIGGMNHYMLPLWTTGLASPKFGNVAMEKLLRKMLESGCTKNHIVAKMFGGAGVIQNGSDFFCIGKRNIEFAEDFLKKSSIPLVSKDVGGNLGRKILFYTDTGMVSHTFISKENNYLQNGKP